VTDALVSVRLLRIPLDIHQQATEHTAEVMREFAHLAEAGADSHVPARLLALDRALQERYLGFTEATSSELDEAIARGEAELDLTFTLPTHVGQAAEELDGMWNEVDRYCEEGRYLLALRAPPLVVAYRQWFLGEFKRQASGEPPLNWPEWSAERLSERPGGST
jgi:hypothetical protein